MRKTALITGASRGIGAATALRLATDGYQVCVNYLNNEAQAQSVVDQIRDSGGQACAIQADASLEQNIIRLFEQCEKELGSPDVLVNNAAILRAQLPLMEMTSERIHDVLSVNVGGVFLCCREAIKRMSIERGGHGGVIVNVSSCAARTGSPGEYIDYAASKGAIDTLTVGLALEVAKQGIRVNAVRPGFIYTDMHADGGEPERVDRLKNRIPLGRGGQADEVAAAIAFLASDESSYTTGGFIDVAGGR